MVYVGNKIKFGFPQKDGRLNDGFNNENVIRWLDRNWKKFFLCKMSSSFLGKPLKLKNAAWSQEKSPTLKVVQCIICLNLNTRCHINLLSDYGTLQNGVMKDSMALFVIICDNIPYTLGE